MIVLISPSACFLISLALVRMVFRFCGFFLFCGALTGGASLSATAFFPADWLSCSGAASISRPLSVSIFRVLIPDLSSFFISVGSVILNWFLTKGWSS